jgi:hypothetical protein
MLVGFLGVCDLPGEILDTIMYKFHPRMVGESTREWWGNPPANGGGEKSTSLE